MEKLADHGGRLRVAHEARLRIAAQRLLERGAVVRLHVVDDQIVEFPAAQRVRQVFKKLARDGGVHGVEQRGLFIQQQVGVVGNAARDGEHVLEQGEPAVVCADPEQVVLQLARAVHRVRSFPL